MKALLLSSGDLAVGQSGDYAVIVDAFKVKQDVRNALVEPMGNDRFHPGWGSSLLDYVGQIADDLQRVTVTGEVNRVVGNYAAVQRDRITADVLSGSTSRFTTDEILSAVTGVALIANQDRFSIKITIGTVAGTTVSVEETLT